MKIIGFNAETAGRVDAGFSNNLAKIKHNRSDHMMLSYGECTKLDTVNLRTAMILRLFEFRIPAVKLDFMHQNIMTSKYCAGDLKHLHDGINNATEIKICRTA